MPFHEILNIENGKVRQRVIVEVEVPLTGDFIAVAATSHMPFELEEIDHWSATSDIALFLQSLRDVPMTLHLADGTSRDRPTGLIEQEEFDRARGQAKELEGLLVRTASDEGVELDQELRQAIGAALKYTVAWSMVVQTVLEESLFFSIAHILETERELDASVRLAFSGHLKPAVQVLRSFIEEAVMPLHFCADRKTFASWRRGEYRTPALRGPSGLLQLLQKQNLIDRELMAEIDVLYGSMNEFVHNAERTLRASGVHLGLSPVLGLSSQRLLDWGQLLSRSVMAAVSLLSANLHQWALSQPDRLFCATCHNAASDGFSGTVFEHGSRVFFRGVCRRCGSVQIHPTVPFTNVESLESDLGGEDSP